MDVRGCARRDGRNYSGDGVCTAIASDISDELRASRNIRKSNITYRKLTHSLRSVAFCISDALAIVFTWNGDSVL